MLEQAAQWFYNDWAVNFLSPQKRLYWGHLLSAAMIAALWLVLLKRHSLRESFGKVFSRSAWLSRSARADYLLFTLNTFIMGALLPRLIGKTAVAFLLFELLHDVFGGRTLFLPDAPAWLIATAFTLFLFVVDDFARYAVHRLMHTVHVLWAFHKVHHSATSLNPLTVLRTHPVEGIIFSLRGAVVQGFCIAVFIYCFGERVSLLMILGANAIKFGFNAIGANLRHSEIPISFWRPLEKVIMSPAQHQIHHSTSPAHFDKNFGVALAIWDTLFRTHCHSSSEQQLQYGLGNGEQHPHTLVSLYWSPVREAFHLLVNPLLAYARRKAQSGAALSAK